MIAGGKGKGNETDQLDMPGVVLIDRINSCLIISEIGNRRISRWSLQHKEPKGEVIISNIIPWGLAMDDEGCFYVADSERHEIRCYSQKDPTGMGHIIVGGNGQGAGLHQLNEPRHIFVDHDRAIYIADANNHRVVKWIQNKKKGTVVLGGQGEGTSLRHLNQPRGLFVDSMGSVYVVDRMDHRVLRCLMRNGTISVIAGETVQRSSNNPTIVCKPVQMATSSSMPLITQYKSPLTLTFDCEGNLYLVYSGSNCIVQLSIE